LNQQHHTPLFRFEDNRFYVADYEDIEAGGGGVWFDLPAEASSRLPQLLGSYNGLAGISIHHTRFPLANTLLLWNPSTGESKLIPDPRPYIRSDDTLGFAYDSTVDDYKFVRIRYTDELCRMDMYSLRNNLWKLIKHGHSNDSEFRHLRYNSMKNIMFPSPHDPTFKHLQFSSLGFGVNGNLYWMDCESDSTRYNSFSNC
jgi:F-box interacting protein